MSEKSTLEMLEEAAKNKVTTEKVGAEQKVDEVKVEEKKQEVEQKTFKSFATQEEFDKFMKTSNKEYAAKTIAKRFKNKDVVEDKKVVVEKPKEKSKDNNDEITELKSMMAQIIEENKATKLKQEVAAKKDKLKKLKLKDEDMGVAMILLNGLTKEGLTETEALAKVEKQFSKVVKKQVGSNNSNAIVKDNSQEDEFIKKWNSMNPDLKIKS